MSFRTLFTKVVGGCPDFQNVFDCKSMGIEIIHIKDLKILETYIFLFTKDEKDVFSLNNYVYNYFYEINKYNKKYEILITNCPFHF